jgi:hypothetical protein
MALSKEEKQKRATRKEFYTSNDYLQMNSNIVKAKDSNLPSLSKKADFICHVLLKNDMTKNYSYTLDSLSNEYRKEVERLSKDKAKNKDKFVFRKSFKSNEVVNIGDIKQAIQYIYLVNKRQFVYYRNDKGNYLIKEVAFIDNLATLKDRKEK